MSARTKKRLTAYTVATLFIIAGLALYILMRESTPQENVEEGGNVETYAPTLISQTKTEIESARKEYKREYIIEKVFEYIDEQSQQTVTDTVTTKIVEVGSGLNYFDETENKWKPSNPHFVDMGSYYELVESAYKVTVPKNLSNGLIYNIDGTPLGLQFKHIVISDGVNRTRLDVPEDAIGSLVEGNASIIRFEDVWTGIDVEYRASKGQFQQDIIIKDKTALGNDSINVETAKVYFYTALDLTNYANDNINITIDNEIIDAASGVFRTTEPTKDKEIIFTKNEQGKPLHILGVSPVLNSDGKEIEKAERQLYKDAGTGTLYFVESIELQKIQNRSILDYNMISGALTEDTFWTAATNTTYYIESDLNVSADLVIEPGTVVKFNEDTSININTSGLIHAVGEPYRYIVFTSKTDDNSGEDLTSTATSGSAEYYDEAINLSSGASTNSRIGYCKIAYATKGIVCPITFSSSAKIENNIIRNCEEGIYLSGFYYTSIRNNLIIDCEKGINIRGGNPGGSFSIRNNTIDNCNPYGIYAEDYAQEDPAVTIKDNLFTNNGTGVYVLNGIWAGNITLGYNGYFQNTSNVSGVSIGSNNKILDYTPYETSSDYNSLGNYYINNLNDGNGQGALLRETGSQTASAAGLDGDEFTYIAPAVLSGTDITSNEEWSRSALAPYSANDQVTIGYHHNRIDKLLNNMDQKVTSGTLTIKPGVVLAIYGTGTTTARRLWITSNGVINCSGVYSGEDFAYPVFTSSRSGSMKIETPTPAVTDNDVTTAIKFDTSASGNVINYTKFIGVRNGIYIDRASSDEIKHCIFIQNLHGAQAISHNITVRNLLFYGCDYGAMAKSNTSGKTHNFYNLTCDNNNRGVYLETWNISTVNVKYSVFTSNDKGVKIAGGTLNEDYNAYRWNDINIENSSGGTASLGSHSIVLLNSPYDTSWDDTEPWDWNERWYLLQSFTDITPCVDKGDITAITAGLNLLTTKNSASSWFDVGNVDLGYHYYADCEGITSVTVTNIYFNDDTTDMTLSVDFTGSPEWQIKIYDSTDTLVYSTTGSGDISNWTWQDAGLEDDDIYRVEVSQYGGGVTFDTFNYYIYLDTSGPQTLQIDFPEDDSEIFGF